VCGAFGQGFQHKYLKQAAVDIVADGPEPIGHRNQRAEEKKGIGGTGAIRSSQAFRCRTLWRSQHSVARPSRHVIAVRRPPAPFHHLPVYVGLPAALPIILALSTAARATCLTDSRTGMPGSSGHIQHMVDLTSN